MKYEHGEEEEEESTEFIEDSLSEKKEEKQGVCPICQSLDPPTKRYCKCENGYHSNCLIDQLINLSKVQCTVCKNDFSVTYIPVSRTNGLPNRCNKYFRWLCFLSMFVTLYLVRVNVFVTVIFGLVILLELTGFFQTENLSGRRHANIMLKERQ